MATQFSLGDNYNGPTNPGRWWQVDLVNIYKIYKVNFYPPQSNENLKFHIEVSKIGAFAGEQKTVIIEKDARQTFTFGENYSWWGGGIDCWGMTPLSHLSYIFSPEEARYVRIVLDGTGTALLKEVQIYGIKE